MGRQIYSGRRHCGAVRFEVDLDHTVACCSICEMRGFRWAFVPRGDFRVIAGAEHLIEHRFHEHVIDHRFRPRCGVEPFAFSEPEGRPTAMVDVRCREGVEMAAPPTASRFDGRSR